MPESLLVISQRPRPAGFEASEPLAIASSCEVCSISFSSLSYKSNAGEKTSRNLIKGSHIGSLNDFQMNMLFSDPTRANFMYQHVQDVLASCMVKH